MLEGGEGISIGGWSIGAKNLPITKDADTDSLRRDIGGAQAVPEQLFGNSSLEISHEATGFRMRFDARSALTAWHSQNLPPLQLSHAQEWRQSRQANIEANNVATMTYDWTFTTPFTGACERTQNGATTPLETEWQTLDKAMDKSILLEREPILFFADVPLYESELDDNGSSQLSTKVRVMPSCWYVLQRFFLRVDKQLVRVRDTRILCKFCDSGPLLVRELLHAEGSFDELSKAGAPATAGAYANADTAADVFQAIAPVGHKEFITQQVDLARLVRP